MNPASTPAGTAKETCAVTATGWLRNTRLLRAVERVLLAVAAIFFALHFVHLKADFPNHSPWMDWSKYTDEGWYGDAAIRHYQLGHWNVPGDFNPAAALPVWPAIEMALFRVTGVSLVAARALTVVVFGLTLVCSYVLIRRWLNTPEARSLAPSIAVLLLAVSPFCYVFSRLAILEPLLILMTLAALLAASAAGAASAASTVGRLDSRFIVRSVVLGLLLPSMVLTKTTGVFLFPSIFWLLWAATGCRVRPFLRAAVLAGGVGAAVWGAYYGLFVRPHYLLDYRYLFSANAYTGITRATFWQVMHDAIFDGAWMGGTLFVLALAAAIGSLAALCVRRWRVNPLAVALLLWIFGYGAFLAYHANLQPRYYVLLAVPLTLLVAIAFDAVLAAALRYAWSMRLTVRLIAAAAGVALIFAAASGARQTVSFVRHPEYGWIGAAEQIDAAIEADAAAHPDHSRLVLSISGSDLALMTGLPAICDDFGTLTLPDRVAKYRPGWFATWNDVDDDKMEALAPLFRLVRVTAAPAFDDPERNLLILYRLDAVAMPGPAGKPGRRRSMAVPNRLRTKVGEQPDPVQLKH